MALIKPLVGEMSGSIGGLTYARNKGGQYVRQRSQVTNPNSPAQQAARSAMAYLAGYWLSTLTAAERTAWEDYAKNVSVTNRLGEKIYLSGQNMFIRSNAPRQRNSLAIVDAAPTEYILAELEPVGADMAGTAGGTSFDLTFDDSADWCSDDGAHLLVQVSSSPQNATINFFRGPFRAIDPVDGSSTTPPTSPVTVTVPYVLPVDQIIFVRVRLSDVAAKLSSPQIVRSGLIEI